MKSTGTSVCARTARARIGRRTVLTPAVLWCLLVAGPLSAQGRTMLGLRGGAGVGWTGEAVYTGQIEILDVDRGGSVELAVSGWTGVRTTSQFEGRDLAIVHDYDEEMNVRGFGVLATYLWSPLRRTTGPYLALGLGLGALWVDWRTDSTDPRFGTPLPGGGSFRAEEGIKLGSLLSVGIGQRLHDRFDLRAQVLSLLVPSSSARENAELVPLLTLTTGIRL